MGISSSVTDQDYRNCTTPPITRILPKLLDPRSPTEGIVRTPIEVNCTPKSKDVKVSVTSSTFDTPKSGRVDHYSGTEIIKKLNIDCIEQGSEILNSAADEVALDDFNKVKDSVEESEIKSTDDRNIGEGDALIETKENVELESVIEKTNKLQTELQSPPKKTMYLETDIDAIDENFVNNLLIEHPRVKQLKSKSINTGAAQNDLSKNSSMEVLHSETLCSRIDGMSFSDMPSFNDLSLMVSDNEEVSLTAGCNSVSKPTVEDWLITIEDNCDSLLPFDMLSPRDVSIVRAPNPENSDPKNNSLNDAVVKNIFRTPDNQTNQPLNVVSERTPLSCLIQNKICEPIKDSSCLKKKQWRGIHEERQRRGLSLDDENTPPLAPPVDKVWSAPGKLIRRRNIVEWDQDNATVLI